VLASTKTTIITVLANTNATIIIVPANTNTTIITELANTNTNIITVPANTNTTIITVPAKTNTTIITVPTNTKHTQCLNNKHTIIKSLTRNTANPVHCNSSCNILSVESENCNFETVHAYEGTCFICGLHDWFSLSDYKVLFNQLNKWGRIFLAKR
jgi:hypothetical protein